MQIYKRILRDVLVVAAVGATASVQADGLARLASFEDLAQASLDDYMPWGVFGGAWLETAGEDAGSAADEADEIDEAAALLSGITLPDPASWALLLGGLGALGLWRRRVQRRRHAGGLGAYLA